MSSADAKKAARARFEAVWIRARDELLDHFSSQGMPDDAREWFKRNLDYNTPGGKLNRGLSVVDTVAIIKARELTEEEYFKAAILGWGVELLQAYFLVVDDIMDASITRRGQPCWYRVNGVGNIAINDAFMLEAAIYYLLRSHFRKEKYYVDLLEIFHDTTYRTEFGQLIDLLTAPEDHVDLNRFSLKKHQLIVIYKTAYYSFYLPVALGMLMCGIPASETASFSVEAYNARAGQSPAPSSDPYQLALDILIPLGEYFQVQDDFLDYAGTPEQIGKIGTDILDNKCSWCVNTALQLASPEQRKILDENYGRKDAASEARVKQLYEELNIRGHYEAYEQQAYNKLTALISSIPENNQEGTLKREVFTSFLNKIYKRQK